MLRANMNHEQMKKRGIFASLPEINFLLPESLEIVVARELDRWTEGGGTLDENFSRHVASTGATGDLGQQLKGPFSSPEIGHMQADIRVDDAYQRDVWEIQALGNHLRPDQNVDFTGSKRLQRLAICVFARHRVSVHSGDCGRRKKFANGTFDFLGSVPCIANGR